MKICDLTFSYSDKPVYSNFSLELDEKKVCCVMGNSGGGKTTLLNCISGQLAYNGDIFYGLQQPRLIPSLTVENNIKFVLEDTDKQILNNKVEDIANRMEISDCLKSYPWQISGGQASRVAIARALVRECDVLLMDEPFKGLDIKLKRQILDTLTHLIKDKTVIFVTHDVEEALVIADRIIVLSGGNGQTVKICEDVKINEERVGRDLYCARLNEVRSVVTSSLLKN